MRRLKGIFIDKKNPLKLNYKIKKLLRKCENNNKRYGCNMLKYLNQVFHIATCLMASPINQL